MLHRERARTGFSPAVAFLWEIWQENQSIYLSIENPTTAGFILGRDRAQKGIKREIFHHREVLANHS
jgi:hypothetical protein